MADENETVGGDSGDVTQPAEGEQTAPPGKPKRTRNKKPQPAPVEPVEVESEGDDAEVKEETTAEPPKKAFMCSIKGSRDRVLEEPTRVEAETAADAWEKYLAAMGVNSVDLSSGSKLKKVVTEA